MADNAQTTELKPANVKKIENRVKLDVNSIENSVDLDQLASSEAI